MPPCRPDDGLLPSVRRGARRECEEGSSKARGRGVMGAHAPVSYCGRCGAPLPPQATFCGRCGTPLLMQAIAAQPVHGYPQAPRVAYPPAGQYKLAPALIAGGLVLILIVVAVVVGGFALSGVFGGYHLTGSVDCSPKIVGPPRGEADLRRSAYNVPGQ